MKTVGERIRQAREFRGFSGEELALRVGYKTQSGISNLENRLNGRGGFALPRIAEELNFALSWLLQGPDTDDMFQVPPFREPLSFDFNSQANETSSAQEPRPPWNSTRLHAHQLLDQLSEKGVMIAVEVLQAMVESHPIDSTKRAGVPVPATIKKMG